MGSSLGMVVKMNTTTHSSPTASNTRQTCTADEGTLCVDTVHTVLSNSARRAILRVLTSSNEPVSLHDLATGVSTNKGQREEDVVDTQAYRDVRGELVHQHLPVLEREGIVTYDSDEKVVTETSHLGQFEAYLELDAQAEQ